MGFWKGKRVLVTGHTGFKGSWLCEILLARGSSVSGLALEPGNEQVLFRQLGLETRLNHSVSDIRNAAAVRDRMQSVRPQIVFHLAAQSLVRRSYLEPLETFAVNVMGTANVLEAVRGLPEPCIVVVVTTDKVYQNREWEQLYRETDPLGGHDPYSASKAATELVVNSYRNSFLAAVGVRVATARAGNVIGGGDWALDRIVPDIARAFTSGDTLKVRNARSIRPWQHVLDPLAGYLRLAEALASDKASEFEDCFNFGPEPVDQRNVVELVLEALRHWEGRWEDRTDPHAPHEAGHLALSIERSRTRLGWAPRWGFVRAVKETMQWYREAAKGQDIRQMTQAQIAAFEEGQ